MTQHNNQIKRFSILGLLTGILILMAFTPLGYLHVTAFSITFNMIPVAIGAIAYGSSFGAVLGIVFGMTSFLQCFGMNAIGTVLFGINPFYTLLLCLVPRILMGCCVGWIYRLLTHILHKPFVSYTIAGCFAAIFNTVFYMTALVLLFGKTEIIQQYWNELAPGKNIVVFIFAFVGINAFVEAVSSAVLTGAICYALYKAGFIMK